MAFMHLENRTVKLKRLTLFFSVPAFCVLILTLFFWLQQQPKVSLSSTAHVECVTKKERIGNENAGLRHNVTPIGKSIRDCRDNGALKSVVAVPEEASRRLEARPMD